MAWKLSVRDEKGVVHALALEEGGDTTIKQLKRMIGEVSKIPQCRQVWRAGFPPKAVLAPGLELPPLATVSTILTDRDRLVLERATDAQLASARDESTPEPNAASQSAPNAATPSTPVASGSADNADGTTTPASRPDGAAAAHSTPEPAAGERQSGGQRASTSAPPLGGGAHDRTPPRRAIPVEAMVINGSGELVARKPKRQKRLHFPGSARTLEDEGGAGDAHGAAGDKRGDLLDGLRAAEDGALGALLQAARGGAQLGNVLGQDWSPGNRSIFKALRSDLRKARSALGNETIANEKVAAARSGKVSFRDLDDESGRMEAVWMSGKKECRECVPGIPTFLLAAVLITLYHDDDANARVNLQPLNMAQVSPKTFWALVRHGPVGPTCTFGQALKKVVPSLDWEKLDVDNRERKAPERFAEYVRH